VSGEVVPVTIDAADAAVATVGARLLTATSVNSTRLSLVAASLVLASPTRALEPMGIVMLPTSVQVDPSADHEPVNRVPARTTLIHAGAVNECKVVIKNIHSEFLTPENAVEKLQDVDAILVAPGFGSRGIEGKIHAIQYAREQKVPFFGICLGMQLMGSESTEDGKSTGLNLIPASVEAFSAGDVGAKKIPHIGFDQVSSLADSQLFQGIPENADFYFVHSFRMKPVNKLI
jgi:imidazole glycerol phosphate synthase glutamine amidotransferase subunit